jgi:hypothetical protein
MLFALDRVNQRIIANALTEALDRRLPVTAFGK